MLVKVWNDNTHPFSQVLADKNYTIAAKGFLELDEEEADRLVKAWSPIKVDFDDRPLPSSYKKLRIDADDLKKARQTRENKAKSGTYLCQACGYVCANKWELDGHIKDLHADQFEDKEEAIKEMAKSTRKKA